MNSCGQKLIKLDGISMSFSGHTVLDSLSLEVEYGDFISVVGESGCGKSTLINIIGMLLDGFSGDYYLDGTNIGTLSDRRRAAIRNRKIGFIFQNYNLIETMTVEDNILLPASYLGERIDAVYLDSLYSELGIGELRQKKAALLSGGEKQRVSIARALINSPELIIADEPTGNLDENNTEGVFRILKKLNEDGKSIIMVTHSRELASRTGRSLMLTRGRLQEVTA